MRGGIPESAEIRFKINSGDVAPIANLLAHLMGSSLRNRLVGVNPPQDAALQRSETVDGAHDRIETRQHTVCHDVDWLFSDRRYPGEPVFPGLAMLGMISSKTERGGNETRYYLGSAKLDADTFARAVRGHWGIENRLHWVLDVVFHDDLARLRTGFGPQNMILGKTNHQPEKPQETRRLERRLPRRSPSRNRIGHSLDSPDW
jgi:predicted transposase YbfD/YdcC